MTLLEKERNNKSNIKLKCRLWQQIEFYEIRLVGKKNITFMLLYHDAHIPWKLIVHILCQRS